MKHTFYLFIAITFTQCSSKYNDNIEAVLDGVGGKRGDLEAVLEHYVLPADSLKRKAAHFLVENFPENQVQTIDKQLMIENIDLAFQVWKKPWVKHLSFDEFKELVLPFNLEKDSTGTFWRKRLMKEYAFVEDSLKRYPNENPEIVICRLLTKVILKKYKLVFELNKHMSPQTLNEWESQKKGDCAAVSFLSEHILRSVGLPVTTEITHWSVAHYWSVMLIKGRFIPFLFGESLPGKAKIELFSEFNHIRKRQAIFRYTYAINHNSLAAIAKEAIPTFFDNKHLIDVSKPNIPTQKVTVVVPDSVNKQYAYLALYFRDALLPITWTRHLNNKAVFQAVRSEALYIPACYVQNKLRPIGYPFILKNNGQTLVLTPQLNQKQAIICTKKYPMDDTNLIKLGDIYQLYYWDPKGWQLISQQVAHQKRLIFENVPVNALFWLKNTTRGIMERPFTYENGKQLFW